MTVLDKGPCWICLRRWVRSRFGIRSREEFYERVFVLDDTLVEVDYRPHRIPVSCRTCRHERREYPPEVRGRSDLGMPYHEEGPHTVPGHLR